MQSLDALSPSTTVGFVTFAASVSVYRLGRTVAAASANGHGNDAATSAAYAAGTSYPAGAAYAADVLLGSDLIHPDLLAAVHDAVHLAPLKACRAALEGIIRER